MLDREKVPGIFQAVANDRKNDRNQDFDSGPGTARGYFCAIRALNQLGL